MNILKIMTVAVFLLAMPLSQQAHARQDKQATQQIDRSQAAAKAQQQVKGRVLRVDQTRFAYRVKMLKKNGRVISVDVDKNTGRVQPVKEKD
ncbi:PepSY domain-containing protein [Alteromonas confluentis]|uniref:PepSY domain-containing protein n=1 Tax=Alteromonas confluentis TaxID=1656094 RepID=A0A1E7Z718_9ALTE|nr:PepSY domain-containing protein [Alteromonas confluentis]OFC69325.1 hypothetical protein BFC18_18050 [Alteromonas confluentis]